MNMLLIFKSLIHVHVLNQIQYTHIHKTVYTFFKGGGAEEMKWGVGIKNCSQCINRIFFDIFFLNWKRTQGYW